jgi:hypothetical protein
MGSTMDGSSPSSPITMTLRTRGRAVWVGLAVARRRFYCCFDENFDAIIFTAPTTRRQNMRKNPAIAAKTDARGINESGPIYT